MTGRPAQMRITDVVAKELEQRILDGALRPGYRLPGERDFAVELGVSRPSLRDAIQKLVNKGLLSTRHGGGTYVTDKLEACFVDPWLEMLNAHPSIQTDLLEFRHMLESHAAFLAAERATDADIARLDAAFALLDAQYANNDVTRSIDADVAFHQAIAEASHNVLIGHLTASLLRVIHGHISNNIGHLHARPERWQALQSQHRAIWQAIREYRPDEAAEAARRHVDFVRQSMADAAKEQERRDRALRRRTELVA